MKEGRNEDNRVKEGRNEDSRVKEGRNAGRVKEGNKTSCNNASLSEL